MCSHKSIWALAWLTLVVTLAGTVLADVVDGRIGWAPDSGQGNSLKDHVSFVLFSNTRQCEDLKGGNDSCG